ncbi:MAG: hypothetical protein EP343_09470 [Deltaproteobacteria bacterium]|nr:MAG: hypothetical protein EP343_09470 [Deltaproteobacteria bacterium]
MLQDLRTKRVSLLPWNGTFLLAGALCAFFAFVGCKKGQSSCLQQQVPALLKQFKGQTELDSLTLLSSLEKRCAPLPPTLKFIFDSRHFDVSPSSLTQKRGALRKLDYKDYKKQWRIACPELPSGKQKFPHQMTFNQKEMWTYNKCKSSAHQLLSRTQASNLVGSGYTTLYAPLIVYGWLKHGGVKPNVARRFVQTTFLFKSHEQEIPLLPSFSQVPLKHNMSLVVSSQAIRVNRKKVCDIKDGNVSAKLKKGQNASSYLILPLYEALQQAVQRQKRIAKFTSKSFKPEINVLLDPKLSYRLLTELLYTAGQAGLQHFQFVVGQKKVPFLGAPRLLRISAPQHTQHRSQKPLDLSKLPKNSDLLRALSRGMAKGKKPSNSGSTMGRSKPKTSRWVFLLKLAPKGIRVMLHGKTLQANCQSFHPNPQSVTFLKKKQSYPTQRWPACFQAIQKKWAGQRTFVLAAKGMASYRDVLAMLNAMLYLPDGSRLVGNVELMASVD